MAGELFEKIGIDRLSAMLIEHFGATVGGVMVKVVLAVLWLALIAAAVGIIGAAAFGLNAGLTAWRSPAAQPPHAGASSKPPPSGSIGFVAPRAASGEPHQGDGASSTPSRSSTTRGLKASKHSPKEGRSFACPNGICAGGDINGNPTVNNYGPPRVQNGLYQGQTQVGHAEGAALSSDGQTIFFQAAAFTAYPEQNVPIEYQDTRLECDGLPKPRPKTFVGQLSVMIVGLSCRVIAKP